MPTEKQRSYIHNALSYVSARFPVTSSTPARDIAYQNRQAINSATPKEIELGQAITREQVRIGQATHICEPFERSYFVTNWCLAWKGLEDIFPASTSSGDAIEKTGEKEETENEKESTPTTINAVKRRMMVLGYSMEKGTPNRCTFSLPPLENRILTEVISQLNDNVPNIRRSLVRLCRQRQIHEIG